VDDNNSKCKEGAKEMKENCEIIDVGRWLLDLISDIFGCNCKK
jgi:hypothetical protein